MAGKTNILLVDDEPDFREVMEKFFIRRGFFCTTAPDCLEAIDILGKASFDVIIMDISMPGLNGLDCMLEIKKIYPHLEVIILTGHASVNGGIIGMRKGAFDYCLKPVDFDELLEKVLLAQEKKETAKS